MPIEIVVPQIGEAIADLKLVRWFKKVGEPVRRGEPLFEVDSDKAVVEVEAFSDGILLEILSPDGSTVLPQQVVGLLGPVHESEQIVSEAIEETSSKQTSKATKPDRLTLSVPPVPDEQVLREKPLIAPEHQSHLGETESTQVPPHTKRLVASPKARQLARELGLNLHDLTGSGSGGMIIARDIEAAVRRESVLKPDFASAELSSMSQLRQIIATRMTTSKREIPHYYLNIEADMSQAEQLRIYCLEKLGWNRAPSYTAILVRACALALAAMPHLNINYTAEGFRRRESIDIGVAVSLDNGLIVVVVRDADHLPLSKISETIQDVAERARKGRLRASDIGHKSMVVSNLGMYGIDSFAAIIDIPDPMILAVGRIVERVVVRHGQLAIRPICMLTLSVDHRAIDGAQAASFLAQVKDLLENPFEFLGA